MYFIFPCLIVSVHGPLLSTVTTRTSLLNLLFERPATSQRGSLSHSQVLSLQQRELVTHTDPSARIHSG